ncbi:MAG: hypothetical protein WBC44_01350 [Planctomycetaceae bacterium]
MNRSRTRRKNNLKRIGLAMHDDHGTSVCFPAASGPAEAASNRPHRSAGY